MAYTPIINGSASYSAGLSNINQNYDRERRGETLWDGGDTHWDFGADNVSDSDWDVATKTSWSTV